MKQQDDKEAFLLKNQWCKTWPHPNPLISEKWICYGNQGFYDLDEAYALCVAEQKNKFCGEFGDQ